ncbi:MAG: hypothetical protein ACYTG6_04070 [Planctomycetota bacterium]|jgi:hypothetical protein
MQRLFLIAVASLLVGGLLHPAVADEDEIAWFRKLSDAYAAALEQDKPLMIAINSTVVDGGRVEPAAKELREKTYKDPRVVAAASHFVCAYLTDAGSSDDFGELRGRYGIEGLIVSPQHIFAYPDGSLISRHEYWPYGYGDRAVSALLDLMRKARSRNNARRGLPPTPEPEGPTPETAEGPAPTPETAPVPAGGEERVAWIAEQIDLIRNSGDEAIRQDLLRILIDADEAGDCVEPLLVLLEELKDQPRTQADIIRALGRPGLEIAAEPIEGFLNHKDEWLRANAAVSLEYIGAASSVSALMKYAQREKITTIANHMYRALGRCGVGQAKVRNLLVKKVQAAREESGSYGPIIGLAYFERDPKTAREVEKLIQKIGLGGGRRGGGRGFIRRALLIWCLTEVGFGDERSLEFVNEKVIPTVTESPWAAAILGFYEAAAACCAGDEDAPGRIQEGVQRAIQRASVNPFMDEAREGRDDAEFTPKADWTAG